MSVEKATSATQQKDSSLLEDDDEFEEFPTEEWADDEKEMEVLWEEHWDDDIIEDDFSAHLKQILEKTGQKPL